MKPDAGSDRQGRTRPGRALQERGRRARRQILEAAEELFARLGYAGASLDAIAERAGMSKQRILHYHPTKQALYEAVVGDLESYLADLLDPDAASEELPGVEAWIDKLAARPTLAHLILNEVASPDASSPPRAFMRFASRITDSFEVLLRRLAPQADPDDAFHFTSAIAGTTLFYATAVHECAAGRRRDRGSQSGQRHKQLVMSTTRHLLGEIRRTSPNPSTRAARR